MQTLLAAFLFAVGMLILIAVFFMASGTLAVWALSLLGLVTFTWTKAFCASLLIGIARGIFVAAK